MNSRVLFGAIIGLTSGIILGLFLKFVQHFSGIKVYTLLLNVDFIPIIGTVQWSELTEFSFHLCVSILLGVIYILIPKTKTRPFITSFILTLPTIPLFYQLIHLSIKEIVDLAHVTAFLWWTIGHLFFAISMAVLYIVFHKK
ncbi:hypothetical protein FZW96_10125 [Bacillus sp. BGMRC 2118]|nr:hypothetical protein FZW96_10125 [Bacillus sp. BGMRC 2118]